jgi:hypothetical protein
VAGGAGLGAVRARAAALAVAATVAPGSVDARVLSIEGPVGPHAFGGAPAVFNQLALATALLIILGGAGSLVTRYRPAHGLERQQLRWVTLAAALTGVAMLATGVLVVLGLSQLLGRDSSLIVAAATLAVAAVFQPARRRI